MPQSCYLFEHVSLPNTTTSILGTAIIEELLMLKGNFDEGVVGIVVYIMECQLIYTKVRSRPGTTNASMSRPISRTSVTSMLRSWRTTPVTWTALPTTSVVPCIYVLLTVGL